MGISFVEPPTCILKENTSNPGGQWLPGAVLNAASNCLNFNGKRKLDDVAIVWRDEGYDSLPLNRMTINELRSEIRYVPGVKSHLLLGKCTLMTVFGVLILIFLLF